MPEVPPPELEPTRTRTRTSTGSGAGGSSGRAVWGGASHESLDPSPAGVRARVLRQQERPHSMFERPGLPQLADLLYSRAYSADAANAGEPFSKTYIVKRNRSIKEVKASAEGGSARVTWSRRAISLADFVFRRRAPRPRSMDAVHVIVNPMHSPLPPEEPPEGASHPV